MILKSNITRLPVLAEGGEGIIYEYGDKLIKAYKPHVNMPTKEKKIKLLMAKNLPAEVISPIDIVYDSRNKFIGYIMAKVRICFYFYANFTKVCYDQREFH